MEDENYTPLSWGYTSPEIILKPNSKGYLILCLNYEKDYEGNFELILFSDNEISELTDANELTMLQYSSVLKGFWTKQSAGGCCSEFNFY